MTTGHRIPTVSCQPASNVTIRIEEQMAAIARGFTGKRLRLQDLTGAPDRDVPRTGGSDVFQRRSADVRALAFTNANAS